LEYYIVIVFNLHITVSEIHRLRSIPLEQMIQYYLLTMELNALFKSCVIVLLTSAVLAVIHCRQTEKNCFSNSDLGK